MQRGLIELLYQTAEIRDEDTDELLKLHMSHNSWSLLYTANTVLQQLHDDGGHLVITKTLDKIHLQFYWPVYEYRAID